MTYPDEAAREEAWQRADQNREYDSVVCPVCDGAGEVGTGRREWETGVWETEDCAFCRGAGCVDSRLINPNKVYEPDLRYPEGGWC